MSRRFSVVVALVLLNGTTSFAPSQQHGVRRPNQQQTGTNSHDIRPSVALGVSFLEGLFAGEKSTTDASSVTSTTVQTFVDNLNGGDIDGAISLFDKDVVFDFASFYQPCNGLEQLERRLRLIQEVEEFEGQQIVVDKIISNDKAAGLKFHVEQKSDGTLVPSGRGSAFFTFNTQQGLIQDVFWVRETNNKAGENGLRVLREASKTMESTGLNPAKDMTPSSYSPERDMLSKNTDCAPVQYFAAWSRRDMTAAGELFADDVAYEDTAFPKPFVGRDNLVKHFILCAESFPDTFTFEVDDFVDVGETVCVKWHVENSGEQLPFTRGCSFYEINNKKDGKIQDGIDFIEPAVLKPAGPTLFLETVKSGIAREPARLIPLTVWAAYMYIVFFSDGILPGANALALETRTWEEVRDLSLNFFLVSPVLTLPFSPVVHPMLEGVFNLLLSWAAMFAGFLSDDRKDKPNVFAMLPAVVGMQFLTSAFLLPYLATRSSEQRNDVTEQDLSFAAKLCESPSLGVLMSGVGSMSIVWAFLGRQADFGGLAERWQSFTELISIDRVGSSFLVDLVIFGLFQYWLVEDDAKRRGMTEDDNWLLTISKVPFFGMAAYLVLRPKFANGEEP